MKEEFIALYKGITRKNSDKLLDWLSKTDFFIAPASTRYHLAEEGGLCTHCINVYKRLTRIVHDEFAGQECPYSEETLLICGLLHDLCKVNFYKTEMRNVKVNGTWEQRPYYTVDEQFPFGHGEKSVFLIERFMRLTVEEAVAIRYHMGGFDAKDGDYSLSKAFEKYPLSVFMHIADLEASYLDEIDHRGGTL